MFMIIRILPSDSEVRPLASDQAGSYHQSQAGVYQKCPKVSITIFGAVVKYI